MRTVFEDGGNIICVTDDEQDIISNFLIYSLGQVVEGYISFSAFLNKFMPNGEGIYIPELLGAYRVESAEESYKYSWTLNDPSFHLPDYSAKDYWNINIEPPSMQAMIEIEGDELRRLIQEAYQIYANNGLIKALKRH